MHQWDLETYILAPLGLQNWSLVCPKIDSKSVKLAAETTSPEPSLASTYYSLQNTHMIRVHLRLQNDSHEYELL